MIEVKKMTGAAGCPSLYVFRGVFGGTIEATRDDVERLASSLVLGTRERRHYASVLSSIDAFEPAAVAS